MTLKCTYHCNTGVGGTIERALKKNMASRAEPDEKSDNSVQQSKAREQIIKICYIVLKLTFYL